MPDAYTLSSADICWLGAIAGGAGTGRQKDMPLAKTGAPAQRLSPCTPA